MISFPSKATIQEHADEETWLSYRATRIGGSDMAALFGVSPYGSPYSVWCDKNPTIEKEAKDSNTAMRWGTWVERGIAQGYATSFGLTLHDLGRWTTVQHPTIPWMYVTLDFLAQDPERGLGVIEVKNVDISKSGDWKEGTIGEDGSAPLNYQIQGQQQLAVTGLDWCDLFALIGGNRGIRVRMKRNDDFIATLIDRGNEMVRRIVENDPPDVDGSEATKAAQRLRWPEHFDGQARVLPDAATAMLEERSLLDGVIKEAGKKKAEIEAKLVEHIGGSQYGLVPQFGRISSVSPREDEVKAHTRRVKRSFRFPTKPNPEKAEKMIRELRDSLGETQAICEAQEIE